VMNLQSWTESFVYFNFLAGIGYLTAVVQDICIIRFLNNVKLNLFSLILQSSIFIVSVLLIVMIIN